MYCPNTACPDVQRTGRSGEYRKEVTVCPRCGSYLVTQAPGGEVVEVAQGVAIAYDFEAFVPVCEIKNRGLIPLVHSLLDAADIRYFVRDETILHTLPVLRGAVVCVEPSRVHDVETILAELVSG